MIGAWATSRHRGTRWMTASDNTPTESSESRRMPKSLPDPVGWSPRTQRKGCARSATVKNRFNIPRGDSRTLLSIVHSTRGA